MNDVIETIFKRRSVRKFTDQPVEREKLELLMQAAMAGPSAVNAQPWEFVVITEKEVLDKLRLVLPFAKMAAPAAICVLGSSRRQRNKAGDRFWVQDCSAATENILLAVESLGLGAVWTALHPYDDRKKTVTDLLAIPPHVIPLCFIPVGIPAHDGEAKDKYDASRIHFETR